MLLARQPRLLLKESGTNAEEMDAKRIVGKEWAKQRRAAAESARREEKENAGRGQDQLEQS